MASTATEKEAQKQATGRNISHYLTDEHIDGLDQLVTRRKAESLKETGRDSGINRSLVISEFVHKGLKAEGILS